jgi:hypothetical protein
LNLTKAHKKIRYSLLSLLLFKILKQFIMSFEKIEKYFTSDKNFIKPINKTYALKSKDEFIEILKWWSIVTKSNTIGDLKQMNNNTPLVFLQIGSSIYYINADSTVTGIKEFLKHKKELWRIIFNENGVKNKVTNNNNEEAIPGFYFYKEI